MHRLLLSAAGIVASMLFCHQNVSAQQINTASRTERDNGPAIVAADDREVKIALSGGTVTLNKGTRAADLERGGLLVLQFSGEPNETVLAELARAGVTVHGYISENAYWATAPAGNSLRARTWLRAVARPSAASRISAMVARRVAAGSAGTQHALIISLVPGTTREALAAELARCGAPDAAATMLYADRAALTLPASAILALAGSDLVLAVEPGDLAKGLHNAVSSNTIGATSARSYYGLSGAGVNVGVWDGGQVFKHKELKGRLVIVESDQSVSDHATHVSGSIAAAGKNKAAVGLAPKARIYSYDYGDDVPTEMTNAVGKYGIILSNNSWGYLMGWSVEWISNYGGYYKTFRGYDLFGLYNNISSALDVVVANKKLIIVFSAGNDRDDWNGAEGYFDMTKGGVWRDSGSRYYEADGTYMTIGPTSTAKNVIVVGATQGAKTMSDFSSWGPTRDGRIKPDVSAPGVNIFSCVGNGLYDTYSGTSMAAPVTTGSLALLVEQWRAYFGGANPSPAIIRAIIIATADDAGIAGPDYSFGFGVIDIAAATDLIYGNTQSTLALESSVKRNKTVSYQLTLPAGLRNARVCLAWIDPPGASLVNDLDLNVVSPSGKNNQPWMLNPSSPASKALRGINFRDNVELVTIQNPEPGDTWRIDVKAKRIGSGNKQAFALVIWGE